MSGVLDRIRAVMENRDLTIEAFAAEIGEKPQRIRDMLGGRVRLPGDVLLKAIEEFDLDANWLLRDDSPASMYYNPLPKAVLTKDERRLLDAYRALSERDCEHIHAVIEAFLARGGK